jgi:GNAT superfamily N-acetyltransferase
MARIKYEKDLPTEVHDRPWVSWGDRSDASPWGGKWVLMVTKDVDAEWRQVVAAVQEGKLGPAAKVGSAAWVTEAQASGYPLLVYTDDYRDLGDLRRVLAGLRSLGFDQRAFYKEDAATRVRLYGDEEELYVAEASSTEFERRRDPVDPASFDIIVRIAKSDDLLIVEQLNSKSFSNDADHDPYLVMDWPYDQTTGGRYFEERIGGRDSVCFVAEINNQIVGYLAGALCPNESYRRGSRSELENMFVEEDWRRHRVGTALVDAFIDWSRAHGADEIYVSAYFDNQRAVSFYQDRGFRSYAHDLLLDLRPKAEPPNDS